MSYLVVSNDISLPHSLKFRYNVIKISLTEFITAATSEDGIDCYDEGILFDAYLLEDKTLYSNLVEYINSGVNIIFYTIDNRYIPSYVDLPVKRFSTRVITDTQITDQNVILIFDDHTKVTIGLQDYEKNKIYIPYMDYYDIIKMYAYEVYEGCIYDF